MNCFLLKSGLLFFILSAIACGNPPATKPVEATADSAFWTKEKLNNHLLSFNDSSVWDTAMLKSDMEMVDWKSEMPFTISAFPTPDYNLIGKGSFKGLGTYNNVKFVGSKSYVYNSFVVNKSAVNSRYIKEGNKDEVFYTVVVLTDFVDTVNYSHIMSNIVSRNHPDYIGQGFIKTKQNKLDYTAFITAGRNAYAIVNMRLFDLSHGKTILIAPQKDKSLRTMQIQSPDLSSEGLDKYIDGLLQQKEVKAFFSTPGSI